MLTVDEEIYRLTPALVIATVDKLAQLPWRGATAPLFGLVDSECPRHGWQNPEFERVLPDPAPGRRPGCPPAVPVPAMRLRPPDLIIQDELHLISDALGSMVGLYETVVDRLCTRQCGGGAGPPGAGRLDRDGAAGPRPGGAGVRPRPGGVPAAGPRRRGDVLLPDGRARPLTRRGAVTGGCWRRASG